MSRTFDDFRSPIGLVMEDGNVNTGVDMFRLIQRSEERTRRYAQTSCVTARGYTKSFAKGRSNETVERRSADFRVNTFQRAGRLRWTYCTLPPGICMNDPCCVRSVTLTFVPDHLL